MQAQFRRTDRQPYLRCFHGANRIARAENLALICYLFTPILVCSEASGKPFNRLYRINQLRALRIVIQAVE